VLILDTIFKETVVIVKDNSLKIYNTIVIKKRWDKLDLYLIITCFKRNLIISYKLFLTNRNKLFYIWNISNKLLIFIEKKEEETNSLYQLILSHSNYKPISLHQTPIGAADSLCLPSSIHIPSYLFVLL
jgi:hypothetical protein